MIHTLLIANRGEIALRVIRTCRQLGVRSIAIFTEVDRQAPHVREADDALHVPGYLDIDAVVAAAQQAGADAIHPGYGFLSERAGFARAVEAAGLVLVGPSGEVMDRMGRKDAAREIAIAAGVPVVPSFDVSGFGDRVAREERAGVSRFPVLVKAAAGGGGKGMRIVRRAEEYADAVAAAKREAKAAFGDDTMLVEKYVEHGRHVEVQVLADTHGNVVHLFERDCSTQRRHQKVLEEAPAPTISDEVRKVVTDAAVALAAHVGYTNAGTVEFLLDTEPGPGETGVYFLEMNTRLQVEHPVTELAVQVGGRALDLVELQLRVAAGEELAFTQDEVSVTGHAIEARVYAEDPFHGFLPQAGRAVLVRWPQRARVDAALESGQEVSTAYDPMLGKVIAHGPDREAARRALVAALDDTAILGLTTNVGFLRILAASDEFRDATIDTGWLDHATVAEPDDDLARMYAAWTSVAVLTMTSGDPHPFSPDGWRMGAAPAPVLVELDRPVRVDRGEGRVDDGERVWQVEEHLTANHTVVLTADGNRCRAVVNVTAHSVEVVLHGHRHVFEKPDVFADTGPAAGDGSITAPMPGTVLDVRVGAGHEVAEGDVLGTMEAMKMELALTAPFAGTVAAVDAKAGEQVALGARLFLVEQSLVEAGEPGDSP